MNDTMQAIFDVLVIGGVGVDTIVRVPELPLPMADSIHVPAIIDYVAHTGNGVSLACQALGMRVKLIDFIGHDREADLILARYRATGLDFSYLIEASGTRRSVNLVDPKGRRLSLYDGRHPPQLRMPREFYLPFLQQARHVHVSIMDWARHVFNDIDQLNQGAAAITSSTDLHDWDGIGPYQREFAQRADVVFVSGAALGERYPHIMREILQQGRARCVVVMAGEKGSYLLERGQTEVIHFPCADPGGPIIDSNGAGDSFVGAFLYGFLQALPLPTCMRLGALAGAYACTQAGTHEHFLTQAQMGKYLT
jgi:acarbose 7IV-phosphotransferase